MASTKSYDCIVIGSGQGGTPLAAALAQSGRKTALIERSHIGGCCVNEGCTPTKTMIASGQIAHLAGRAGEYGIWQTESCPTYNALRGQSDHQVATLEGAEKIRPVTDMLKVRQRKRDIVESFRGGSEKRLKGIEGLEVIMGEAKFIGPKCMSVQPGDGGAFEVTAETFFIDAGERPSRPELSGLDDVEAGDCKDRVLNSTTIMELDAVPLHLVVLGGGYIGMEFGQLFHRLGSKVTIIQKGKQLLPREDARVAEEVRKICTGDGMEVVLNAKASSIHVDRFKDEPLQLVYTSADGMTKTVPGSHLLLAAGRVSNADSLALDTAGVKLDARGHIVINERLETDVPHIFALGDIKGGPAFTHISYDDYRIIKANFIDKVAAPLTITDRQVPYVVFMDPQLAHIGLHEHEARAKFPTRTIKTATMPMAWVARAIETDETRGMMKAVVDAETEEILGFTMLGKEGGEIMSLVQVAMMGKLKYGQLQNATFAHPTLAESLNNLWGSLE